MALRNSFITIKYAGVQISFLSYELWKYYVGDKDFYKWSQTFGRQCIEVKSKMVKIYVKRRE